MDLRPLPAEAAAVGPEGFAVLVGALAASSSLDGKVLAGAVDDADVKAKVWRRCYMLLHIHRSGFPGS